MHGAHSIIFKKKLPAGSNTSEKYVGICIINTLNNKVLFKYKKNHIFFFVIPW